MPVSEACLPTSLAQLLSQAVVTGQAVRKLEPSDPSPAALPSPVLPPQALSQVDESKGQISPDGALASAESVIETEATAKRAVEHG